MTVPAELIRRLKDLETRVENMDTRSSGWGMRAGRLLEVTLAGGSFANTPHSHVEITSESGTSDDLDTISAGHDGKMLALRPAAGHTITVKHGTGNIVTAYGSDVVLEGAAKSILLVYHRPDALWYEHSSAGIAESATVDGVRVLFSQTEDETVANTVSETSLLGAGAGSKYVPADSLEYGTTLRFSLAGHISFTGTPTLELKVYLGGVELCVTGANATGTVMTETDWHLDVMVTCRSAGASGTVVATGMFSSNNGDHAGLVNTSAVTVDTTVNLLANVTATWGTADAANTITCQEATIEHLPITGLLPSEGIEETEFYYGDMKMYVMWDAARLFRTDNIQDASPTWELVDTGVTGTIKDGIYVTKADNTVGMWLLTSDAVWWCDDIMAVTPSWTSVLPIATVIANDTAPSSGTVSFGGMASYDSAPGYLIVATSLTDFEASWTYQHAYFWHTHDFGQNWTQVDMNSFLFESLGYTRGYTFCGTYGIHQYNSSPGTIWAVREAGRVGGNGRTSVFKSTDLGDTWTQEWEINESEGFGPSILKPFPDVTDPGYVVRGNTSEAMYPKFYRTTDQFATMTEFGPPAGYDNATTWRPNSNTFEPDHVILWWQKPDLTYDLLESDDQGATWTLVYASGQQSDKAFRSLYNTPNGWPPDVNQWVIVASDGIDPADDPRPLVVQWTGDKFSSLEDKEGNLFSLIGTWSAGTCSGFALPRLGRNA